jgi:hypothetical protein
LHVEDCILHRVWECVRVRVCVCASGVCMSFLRTVAAFCPCSKCDQENGLYSRFPLTGSSCGRNQIGITRVLKNVSIDDCAGVRSSPFCSFDGSSPAIRANLLPSARYQTHCGYCGGYTPGVLCPGVLPPAAVTFAAARRTGVVSVVLAVFAGRSTSGDP